MESGIISMHDSCIETLQPGAEGSRKVRGQGAEILGTLPDSPQNSPSTFGAGSPHLDSRHLPSIAANRRASQTTVPSASEHQENGSKSPRRARMPRAEGLKTGR